MGYVMQRNTKLAAAAAGLVIAAVGTTLLVVRSAENNKANRADMDLSAQVLQATPARELVVMRADARVFSSAEKKEILNQKSTLYYISRAKFAYSVDMKEVGRERWTYDAGTDVLKIRLPPIKVASNVYGERMRLASLALGAREGGSGNELEIEASTNLEKNAELEARRPELVDAALKSAKYEVSKLYEDAFRAGGHSTRVIVVGDKEPLV